ncbi:uncharacterized protein MONOS_4770 [Monocercomonoides exilis]|uniref:uncharacterized protein n=1 Tax=Monocercomonoides exilis TaxID=2049356 RepID=UPI00355A9231|nr:hypothetical protein MONOS_4770 [Monocercomonoides exilis]|eukprot:MONOS_4770.1-p1 / transcript=MONOS_4770.1 / gene=MONOS_4770 / organism=Monocercomonoides_exilis_PA203 / gene_product=unspecified product / transcript_product=unspecified product / location=Mono_scaffold00131:56358-57689(+) / protein_length=424 / sequence_SO=supercontig / SO=protein_coding / is_pseudo=false
MIEEELFSELENCPESEQKVKIEEMNGLVEEMNEKEFKSVFNTELYDKIFKMIEEKKVSMENTILLLKHVGYCKVLLDWFSYAFKSSLLSRRFEKMLVDEDKKNEEKNEKLLADLCECFILFDHCLSSELDLICIPCLMKFALKKDESEETRKEAEMALLALSSIRDNFVEQELYLNDIKEIIEYHQEHRNLTRLAYQSAWQFLTDRFFIDNSLDGEIVSELHFTREAARELEDLSKCVDWKKEKEEEKEKETKEELVIERWFDEIFNFLYLNALWIEEFAGLIGGVVLVYRAAKGNNEKIGRECVFVFETAAETRSVDVEELLKGGAVDVVLEGMQRQTFNEGMTSKCLQFFTTISRRLEEKKRDDKEEEERKATKRKVFEKMEEEGYEDIIASFHKIFELLKNKHQDYRLSLKISDYFVNV